MKSEVIKIEQPPTDSRNYEKELYIEKIANHICPDNEEVRQLIRLRLVDMTTEKLLEHITNEDIPI